MNTELINQIILLFSLTGAGYACGRYSILDETANARFSGFLLKVALPATILSSAIRQGSVNPDFLLKATLTAAGIFLLLTVVSRLVARAFHWDATYELLLNYSNLGFMGLPIISSIYSAEGTFLTSVFMMVLNVHIFTFGIITLQGKPESISSMLKKLCTPGILSAILAFVIVLFHLHVPLPVSQLMESLGSVTTPLAMVVIGSQLAQVRLTSLLKNHSLYLMSLFKLVIYPAIVYLVLRPLTGPGILAETATILIGLPVAGNVTMLCSEYHGNVSLAAQGTCMSTLFSLITIPILLFII